MPVLPVYTPGLGESLANAGQIYLQARRQKQQQDQQDQLFQAQMANAIYQRNRQRAEDAANGLHILAPGETIPLDVSQNIVSQAPIAAAPTVDQFAPDFRSLVGGGPAAGSGAPVSRAGAGALNIPGHPDAPKAAAVPDASAQPGPSSFESLMGQALAAAGGQAPTPLPRYEFFPGGYLDRQPQQQAAATARAQKVQDMMEPALIQALVARQKHDQTVQDYVNAGADPRRTAAYVDNPALAVNDPILGKQSGDMSPQAFMLDGKPMQGFVDKRGHFFDAHGNPITTGTVTPYAAPKSSGGGPGGPKFQADQRNAILDDFRDSTKDFEKVRSAWEALQGAIKNPSLATPFAVADAYARVANPGAIVRPTTMQMIEDLGSVNQRFRKWVQKNGIDGQLPPDILRDLVSTIGGMVQENAKTFQRAREQAIARGQQAGVTGLDALLPTFDFVNPLAPQVVAPPAGDTPGNINLGGDTAGTISVNGKTFKVPH